MNRRAIDNLSSETTDGFSSSAARWSSPSNRRLRAPHQAGYTLIELSAVMLIVMILSVSAIATIRTVGKADLSTEANRMATAVRYLYDLAVLNNRAYRLVLDIESNSYWAEEIDPSETCGTGLLPSDDDDRIDEFFAEAKQKARKTAGLDTMVDDEGEEGGAAVSIGKAPKDNLLRKRTLPKGLFLLMVMTGHQDEPTEEGIGEVYFFPSGYVERAYLYLGREDEVYTIETVPLRGKGIIHAEELDPRDLLGFAGRWSDWFEAMVTDLVPNRASAECATFMTEVVSG